MQTRLDFEWRLTTGSSTDDAQALATALSQLDPEAEVLPFPAGDGFAPVLIPPIVAGAVGVVALARRIVDVVCRARKHGLVIDARMTPLRIEDRTELPGGTVITITETGQSTTYDACAADFDLVKVIGSLKA